LGKGSGLLRSSTSASPDVKEEGCGGVRTVAG